MPSPFLEEIISNLTNNHSLDPITDHCKALGTCKLRTGHEVTFVSLIANYIFEGLKAQSEDQIEYHEWVYMPSRRAEAKVGYDLSIGYYDTHMRVRSAHKLLLSWCDNRRSWTVNPNSVDHRHLVRLFQD